MNLPTTHGKLPAIFPVACHTDNVGLGSTFVAIRGMHQDGTVYIPEALARGAKTIVVEKNIVLPTSIENLITQHGATVLRVENSRQALAHLSAQALGHPAKRLKFVAITGTKGKTTSTFLLEHILREAGYKTALLSTVKNKILGQDLPTKLTTQQPDYLHVFFDQCCKEGVEWVVMEVAAQHTWLHR